ncbi:MAG: HAD family hydrolase [Paludibacter sp.]|nr:HAD family hydrolase [Paludibacter sp.]
METSEKYETVFLDRDGVINKHLKNDYVKCWDEFEFLPGVLDALSILAKYFKHIFIVTNQRGVCKGLMTEDTLKDIHSKMQTEIENCGGRIDQIYYCTDLSNESQNRKPNSGMAFQAKNDFPNIEFQNSIMIGDSLSDMEFGNRLGMKTVFINKENESESLINFALSLIK